MCNQILYLLWAYVLITYHPFCGALVAFSRFFIPIKHSSEIKLETSGDIWPSPWSRQAKKASRAAQHLGYGDPGVTRTWCWKTWLFIFTQWSLYHKSEGQKHHLESLYQTSQILTQPITNGLSDSPSLQNSKLILQPKSPTAKRLSSLCTTHHRFSLQQNCRLQ